MALSSGSVKMEDSIKEPLCGSHNWLLYLAPYGREKDSIVTSEAVYSVWFWQHGWVKGGPIGKIRRDSQVTLNRSQ